MSKSRIFLAIADETLREKYRTRLFQEGFAVLASGNGLECIEMLRAWTPELLVLDPELPWGGGDGVLAVMERDPKLALTSVIILGLNDHSDRLERMLNFPVHDVMFAPVSPEELADNIASVLRDPVPITSVVEESLTS